MRYPELLPDVVGFVGAQRAEELAKQMTGEGNKEPDDCPPESQPANQKDDKE